MSVKTTITSTNKNFLDYCNFSYWVTLIISYWVFSLLHTLRYLSFIGSLHCADLISLYNVSLSLEVRAHRFDFSVKFLNFLCNPLCVYSKKKRLSPNCLAPEFFVFLKFFQILCGCVNTCALILNIRVRVNKCMEVV